MRNKKRIFILFLSLLVSLGILLPAFPQEQEELQEKGLLRVKGNVYSYESSYDEVKISNEAGNVVFHVKTDDPRSVLSGVDHSPKFNSFVVFRTFWQIWNDSYQLVIHFQDYEFPLINDSKTPFYTPVLIEHQGASYIAYISESFSIHVWDMDTGEMVNEIRFETPLYDLKEDAESDRLRFLLYDEGKYREHRLKISEILSHKPEVLPINSNSVVNESFIDQRGSSENINNVNGLDYRKVIGFGDSITKGWVAAIEAPELGYIPRLELLLNLWVYETEVINEGRPATKTTDAILVFDDVIELHKAKFILFHYGTNDAIRLQIPVSLTLFNISEMMEKALDYSMLPILSTLIPRDPAHRLGTGVFKNRAVRISDGIKEISQILNIPVIDFYTIFGEFPDGRGGYYMLMSDRVHPSQAGYQLMTWEWYYALIAIPPAIPGDIHLIPLSPYSVEVQWQANIEPNFYYYQIEFGYDPVDLNMQTKSWSNTYIFNSEPFIPQTEPRLFFRIQAVNNLGVVSEFSPVIEIKFGE